MLRVAHEQSEGDETHHQCGHQHHRHNEEQHIFFAHGTDFEVMHNVFDHVYIMAEMSQAATVFCTCQPCFDNRRHGAVHN